MLSKAFKAFGFAGNQLSYNRLLQLYLIRDSLIESIVELLVELLS